MKDVDEVPGVEEHNVPVAIQIRAAAVMPVDMLPPGRFPSMSWSGPPRRSRGMPALAAFTRACNGRLTVEFSSSEVDLDLLQRITTRDQTALAELYDRHSRLVYAVIMRILGSPSDAEDVLQETFVRVWSRADTYDALLGAPATWLTFFF